MEVGAGFRAARRDAAVLRGTIAAAAVRVVSSAVSILTLAIATRALTPEEFGFVATLFSLWMVLTMLDLGIGGVLVTRVATAHAGDDLEQLRGHVRDALVALSFIGAFIAVVGAVLALVLPWGEWVGGSLPGATVRLSVMLVFVLAGSTLPAVIGAMTLTGRQRMATAQWVIAVRSVLTLAATAAAAFLGFGPQGFVLAMMGVPALVNGVLTVWILWDLRAVVSSAGFVASRIRSTIRDSASFAVLGVVNAVAFGVGTLIVAFVRGPAEAAVFTVANRMFATVGTGIMTSGLQLWPALTEAIAQGDLPWVRQRYRQGLLAVGATTTAAGIGLVAFGEPLARVWVGAPLVPSFGLLVWTAVATITMALVSQSSTLLLACDRTRALAVLCGVNAVVTVIASVALTQRMGMSGAAAGSAFACGVVLLPGIAVLVRRVLLDLQPVDSRVADAGADGG